MRFLTVVFLVILASFSVFAGGQKESEMMDKDDAMMSDDKMESDHTMTTDDAMAGGDTMMKSDSMETMALVEPFMDFKDLESASMQAKETPTVLFFYATWCPTCKEAVKDLKANVDKLESINLLIVDYDNSDDLQKMYGVTYQHTFVQIGSDGKEIAKWNGGASDEILMKVKKEVM